MKSKTKSNDENYQNNRKSNDGFQNIREHDDVDSKERKLSEVYKKVEPRASEQK